MAQVRGQKVVGNSGLRESVEVRQGPGKRKNRHGVPLEVACPVRFQRDPAVNCASTSRVAL